MKQITLTPEISRSPRICTGRLLLVWGLFGYALACLSRAFAHDVFGQTMLWVLGALAGLAIATKEI